MLEKEKEALIQKLEKLIKTTFKITFVALERCILVLILLNFLKKKHNFFEKETERRTNILLDGKDPFSY